VKKYTISNKKCRKCGGLISWDDHPSTQYPIHVDSEGNKIGIGSCPKFRPLPVTNKSSFKFKPKPTRVNKRVKIPHLKSPVTLLLIAALVVGASLPIALLLGTNQNAIDEDNNYNPPDPPDPPNPPDPPPSPQWEIDAQGTVTYIVDGDTLM